MNAAGRRVVERLAWCGLWLGVGILLAASRAPEWAGEMCFLLFALSVLYWWEGR